MASLMTLFKARSLADSDAEQEIRAWRRERELAWPRRIQRFSLHVPGVNGFYLIGAVVGKLQRDQSWLGRIGEINATGLRQNQDVGAGEGRLLPEGT
ncbi:MAG: hypothetical protein M3347_06705 [Armatimonadota bacterium]|nr:hypothetical protein [Armatimonadota bacterium]